MAEQTTPLHPLRVFVSCTSETEVEAGAVKETIDELNRTLAESVGVVLQFVHWSTHTRPDAGRPQATINDQIGEYDVVVAVLWMRFGTPTGVAESGVEEEVDGALRRRGDGDWPKIMLYFNRAEGPQPESADDLQQRERILKFRQRIGEDRSLRWHDYHGHQGFKEAFRQHLTSLLLSSRPPTPDPDGGLQDGPRTKVGSQAGAHGSEESFVRHLERSMSLGILVSTPASYYNLGIYYSTKLDSPADALRAYARAEELGFKATIALHNNKANALVQLRQYSLALEEYGKALSISADDPLPHNGRGNALLHSGRFLDALEEYEEAVSLLPDYVHAHCGRGLALRRLERYEEAMAAFNRALEIDPKEPIAHIGMGQVRLSEGELDEAVTCFKQALRLDPRSAEAHNSVGVALARGGQHQEALDYFSRAIELDARSPLYRKNQANTLDTLARYDEAIAAYHEAISLAPELDELYGLLSNSLYHSGRTEEAFSAVDELLRRSPDSLEGLRCRASLLEKTGRCEEAIQALEQVRQLDPDGPETSNALGWVLIRMQRHGEATAVLRDGLARSPDNAFLLSNLAIAVAQDGDREEALRLHDSAIALKPGAGVFHLEKASTLAMAADYNGCLNELKMAIGLEPQLIQEARNYPALSVALEDPEWGAKLRESLGGA